MYFLVIKGIFKFIFFLIRNRESQQVNNCLVKIEGVNNKKDTEYYLGKRVAYIYRGTNKKTGGSFRSMWGRVRRAHGNSGVVICTFRHTLPPCAMGKRVRVMLYPSRV